MAVGSSRRVRIGVHDTTRSYAPGPSDRLLTGRTIGDLFDRVTDAFPMTVTGKIQEFKMRQEAVEALGRSEDATVPTA